ncbi:MAG TPA: sialidase family protein [Pyrinomonadaceae bacterium]|jgi:hypothetical protein
MPAKKSSRKAAAAPRKAAAKKAAKKVTKKAGAAKGARKRSQKGTGGAVLAPSGILLVNMIPKALSGESHQDSEPHLTVNPANPLQIVGTAFTPDPGGGVNAPIFISADGGNTWLLNAIVPSAAGSATHDITTGFSGTSKKLYGSILRAPTSNLEFLRTTDAAAPVPMTVLKSRPSADQPFAFATTVAAGVDAGKERLYVGNNDFAAPSGHTATIDHSLNAGVSSPTFSTVRIEKRSTVGQDGPQIRPVAHRDGTVYAVFYRWRALTGSFPANTLIITSADVVVVRDDKWGAGGYTALTDPSDGLAGRRVVQGVSFPFMISGTAATGQQRLGGSLSIAVDPTNSSRVYMAWCDKQPNSMLTLHVRRSTDRGVTWSAADLLTIESATNAALAINSAGKIGLLFQQFRGLPGNQRWVTRLRRSTDGINWDDLILANVPAFTPVKTFDPYIGDYDHLVAQGKDFYGIFSANNTPDLANFPNGVKYLRVANFATHKLFKTDGVTVVPPSIDPFFFKITES